MSRSGQVTPRFGHANVDRPTHRHAEALLIVGVRGAATIGTGDQDWAIARRSMLWVSGDTPHRIRTTADHHSLVISFPPDLVARPTGWIEASGFVHDLVERVSEAPDPERRDRLVAVLVDELAADPRSTPVPAGARLSRVTQLVTDHPEASVAALARGVGMSERAFRRWFRADVGTSFTRWHQARIVDRAIEELRRGESVKRVAADLGYASASAFSAMFKRVTSAPPHAYLPLRGRDVHVHVRSTSGPRGDGAVPVPVCPRPTREVLGEEW